MPTFFAADGAELAYEENGPRGDIPLLFLHGWLAAGTVWSGVVERLARRHRTIAVDFRGFGASSGAPRPYRVETFADDLSALIAALDLDPLVAIGHSMGGAVAQRFAIDRPEAVEGLVLVAPVPAGGLAFPPNVDGMFRSLPGDLERTNAWLASLWGDEPASEARKIVRDAAAAVAAPVALESYESWSSLDFADEAATIVTPTLVIAPERDRPFTPAYLRERVANPIAGSRFEVVPGAGHLVPLERPADLAALIERFVDAL